MSKYTKFESARLFSLLDSKKANISHEDQVGIKEILQRREARRQRAAEMIEAADISSILAENDLNWTISLNPLACVIKYEEEDTAPAILGIHETLYWPMRDDTCQLLGRFAANGDKPIIQNREMLELGLRLANADNSEVTFIKTTGNGESIVLAIKAGDVVAVGPDRVQRYIYLLDNRTSEHGLRIGFGETNLRCTNQIQFINNTAAHKIRHTKNMADKINAIIDTYDVLAEEMEAHHRYMLELVDYKFEEKAFDEAVLVFIEQLTGIHLKNDYANVRIPAGWDLAVQLSDCIYEEAEAIGFSAWTLLNGVTRLTTHERQILYPRTEIKSLEEGLAYGKEGVLLTKAYETLMTLIN